VKIISDYSKALLFPLNKNSPAKLSRAVFILIVAMPAVMPMTVMITVVNRTSDPGFHYNLCCCGSNGEYGNK
jgi:hypothetical protein